MYRIALSKGVLFDKSKEYLQSKNISFDIIPRKLILDTNHKDIQILIVRGSDVLTYVEHGVADTGIIGSDTLLENNANVIKLRDLNYGGCNLAVAVPNDSPIQSLDDIPDYVRVATKFTTLTQLFFEKRGIPINTIKLHGSIEIAPIVGLSDIIVDLVGTGETLRQNGLRVISTISTHTAHLIFNRVSYEINNNLVQQLV